MKKVISLILSLVMLFTLSTPVLAVSNDTALTGDQQKQTTISLSDVSRMEIISPLNNDIYALSSNNTNEMINDQSFLIKEYTNNELTHTVQGTFGGNQLICTDYVNGMALKQRIINIADRVVVNINNDNSVHAASSNSYGSVLGRIVYNKDIGNTVPGEILTVYSKVTKQDSEAYTINGHVADTISDITGILLSVFFALCPIEAIWAKVAIAIVSYYGGKVLGDKIGVAFSEKVSADATYYTLTGYHAASDYYSPTECNGVERFITTKDCSAYQNWFYEGYTPHTWKDGDDLATTLWMAVFARPFPYVYRYY